MHFAFDWSQQGAEWIAPCFLRHYMSNLNFDTIICMRKELFLLEIGNASNNRSCHDDDLRSLPSCHER